MKQSFWITATMAVALSVPLPGFAQSSPAPTADPATGTPYAIATAERHDSRVTPPPSAGAEPRSGQTGRGRSMTAMERDRTVPVYGLPPRPAGEVIIFGQPVNIR
jgi:hypothetical protein